MGLSVATRAYENKLDEAKHIQPRQQARRARPALGREPSYSLTGHQVDDGKDYKYVYDAFGRLMEVRDRGTDDLVAAYRYNGLNFRTGWRSDVTDDSGGGPDGVIDQHDPWFWFCYDDRWRVVAVFRDIDEVPKEVFVHHNAGLAGYGGSSYIDSVILRDRDTSAAWHEEIEENLRDERVYYAQNWRGDVSALLTDTGSMIEWVKYSAYGVPYSLPAGDTDSDGTWGDQDEENIATFIGEGGTYDVRFDTDLDGVIDDDDITHANSIAGGFQTLGRGVLSSPAVANRVGYAGYRYDPTFKGAGRTIYHVRHRVYDADVGRWTRRDPLGYVDGMSLYQYVLSLPMIGVDPSGLRYRPVLRGVVVRGRDHGSVTKYRRNIESFGSAVLGYRGHHDLSVAFTESATDRSYNLRVNARVLKHYNLLNWSSISSTHVASSAIATYSVGFACNREGRIRVGRSTGGTGSTGPSKGPPFTAAAAGGIVELDGSCATVEGRGEGFANWTQQFQVSVGVSLGPIGVGVTPAAGNRVYSRNYEGSTYEWCCVKPNAGNGGGTSDPPGGGGGDPGDPTGGGGPVIPPSTGFPGDLMDPPDFPGGGTGFTPGIGRPGFPGRPGSGGGIVLPRVPLPGDELQPGIPYFPGFPGLPNPGRDIVGD